MRPDIVPGATFPDYELTDHTRQRRRLSELQGDDPMILVLSRGHFCPKDHQQHLELAAFFPKIAVSYTKIVTITTDNLLELNEFRASVGAQWTFLSDPRRIVQQDLDIAEYTDQAHDPMIPHTFVLAPGLEIHRIYNGYWFWGRPSPEELRRDLRQVFMKVRPDWDLGAPGLRDAWETGDHSRFYPYRPRRSTASGVHDWPPGPTQESVAIRLRQRAARPSAQLVGRELDRALDCAVAPAVSAPVELGLRPHRHRPCLGRPGAGPDRA